MCQPRDVGNLVHALDLHPRPAFNTDVDILARPPDTCPDFACAARQLPEELSNFGHFPGRPHVGVSHGLDQRDAQPVCFEDSSMPDVTDLTAGILFQT